MPNVIYKYPVKSGKVLIPSYAHILTAEFQGSQLCLWADVNLDIDDTDREILVSIVPTGSAPPPKHMYLKTCFQGAHVWHIYYKL